MFPSARYKAWIVEAIEYVELVDIVRGPYKLFITAARPDKRNRDLDNLIKPINDFLKRIHAIEDDHLCEAIHARWVSNGDGVAVRIEPAGTE